MKNKCEYCTFDEDGFGEFWEDESGYESRLANSGEGVYIETLADGDCYYSADFTHCPKCGRDLNDDI